MCRRRRGEVPARPVCAHRRPVPCADVPRPRTSPSALTSTSRPRRGSEFRSPSGEYSNNDREEPNTRLLHDDPRRPESVSSASSAVSIVPIRGRCHGCSTIRALTRCKTRRRAPLRRRRLRGSRHHPSRLGRDAHNRPLRYVEHPLGHSCPISSPCHRRVAGGVPTTMRSALALRRLCDPCVCPGADSHR